MIDEFENPELIPEYLESLQAQIDALRERNEKLNARVARLTSERESLRQKLPKRQRPAVTEPNTPATIKALEVPGVGTMEHRPFPTPELDQNHVVAASILDDFSHAGFQYEMNLHPVDPSDSWQTLEHIEPDLLFVESAYNGQGRRWAGRIARFGGPDSRLLALVESFRDAGKPTVFWCKEDPINFDWFSTTAGLFDHVFTVDAEVIPAYRKRLGHSRVHLLQFAAQPKIHRPPIDSADRVGEIAFAGTYYAQKHPDRRHHMETILRMALPEGLQIFDRMANSSDVRFQWPSELAEAVVGSLTYEQTTEAYRRYHRFINVNTVTDSPTMIARRVYELLASGTTVISTPAASLVDVPVTVVNGEDDFRKAMAKPPDPSSGFDWIHAGNRVIDRVNTILSVI